MCHFFSVCISIGRAPSSDVFYKENMVSIVCLYLHDCTFFSVCIKDCEYPSSSSPLIAHRAGIRCQTVKTSFGVDTSRCYSVKRLILMRWFLPHSRQLTPAVVQSTSFAFFINKRLSMSPRKVHYSITTAR